LLLQPPGVLVELPAGVRSGGKKAKWGAQASERGKGGEAQVVCVCVCVCVHVCVLASKYVRGCVCRCARASVYAR